MSTLQTFRRHRKPLGGALAALMALWQVGQPLQAAAYSWDTTPGTIGAGDSAITGGTGIWNTANGNWTTDAGVNNVAWGNTSADEAIFGGAGGTITINTGSGVTANKLTFNSDRYVINSNVAADVLTLDGASPTISVATAGHNAVINAIIAGTTGLTKSGAGILTLNGLNTYSGGTTLSAGALRIWNNANLGAAGSALSLNGGTLQLAQSAVNRAVSVDAASSIDVARGSVSSVTGVLSGSSGLTKTGNGELRLNGNNTYSGALTVDSGIVRVRTSATAGVTNPYVANLNAATGYTINAGGQLIADNAGSVDPATTVNMLSNTAPITLNGGRLAFSSTNVGTSAVFTEQVGNVLLNQRFSSILSTRTNATSAAVLALGNVTRTAGATVSFSGSGTLGATGNNSRITFNTAPTLNDGLIGGWALAGAADFAGYVGTGGAADQGVGALGSAGFPAYATKADIATLNTSAAGDNVFITTGAAFGAMGNLTINSLKFTSSNSAAAVTQTAATTLTIDSGGILTTGNFNKSIGLAGTLLTGGMLKANGGALYVHNEQGTLTINSIIQDGDVSMALVKDQNGGLTLAAGANSTYTGGTYINGGTLTTGTAANRTYLGTGPVFVNGATLALGRAGATSSTSGYTITNGGQVTLGSNTLTYSATGDRFNFEAGSVLAGSAAAANQGLNNLTRVATLTAGGQVILAPDSVMAYSAVLAGAFDPATQGVKTLGTAADLYFGLGVAGTTGSVSIGAGTPFKGLSTDRTSRTWTLGTINVTTGTPNFNLQGLVFPDAAGTGVTANTLTLGNGTTAGGFTINAADVGPFNARVTQGAVSLDDDLSVFGTAGSTMTFVVEPGAVLQGARGSALGSGTGIANVRVLNGGTIQQITSVSVGAESAFNGNVVIEAGGRFLAQNGQIANAIVPGLGLTGTGTITFQPGSILHVTNTEGWFGSQANATILPDTAIVRLGVALFGTAAQPLLTQPSFSGAGIYEVFGGNNGAANPTLAGTTILALNNGGILTNDNADRNMTAAANGVVTVGAGGATFAATNGTFFNVQNASSLGANTLTIGSTKEIDGNMKKGEVRIGGLMSADPGALIDVIDGAGLRISLADALDNDINVQLGAASVLNVDFADTINKLIAGSTSKVVGDSALTLLSGDTYNLGAELGGTASLTQAGSGVLTIDQNTAATGNATLGASLGTLKLGTGVSIGSTYSLALSAVTLNSSTFDLNGNTNTMRAVTANSTGTATIDNTSATPVTLTIGSGDTAVAFGNTGTGTYNITDSGAGALSIVKTGTGTATLGGGVGTTSLTYQGSTSVNGGILNIAGTLDGTTSLSVTGAATSALNITGAMPTPAAITTVTINNGAALSIANGSGTPLSLSSFSLGASTGATLGFDLGASNLLSDSFTASGIASAANAILFNITGLSGFGTITSYNLLSAAATSGLNGAAYSIASAPGGYTYGFTTSDTSVQLNLTPLAAGNYYWTGNATSQSWSNIALGNSNFSTTADGLTEAGASPGSLNTVNFSGANAGIAAKTTTLDTPYSIAGLNILNTVAGNVTIASGLGGVLSTLTIGAGGIDVQTGAPAITTISAPVVVGANQTWDVEDLASSLVISGAVSGSGNVDKTGPGILTISADSPSYSGITTITGGTLNVGAGGATGSIGTGNIVNNSVLVFNRDGTFTVSNLISGSGTLTKLDTGIMTLDNGSNSFTGPITVTAGTLAYTTIGNVSAGNTSLGAPVTALNGTITLGGGTLSFAGSTNQSTDRLIATTASSTLNASGTLGATITYNGAITQATDNSLTLNGTGVGLIKGGITQPVGAATADLTVSSGTWTIADTNATISDDVLISAGASLTLQNMALTLNDDIVNTGGTLNLGSTGVWATTNPAGTSSILFVRGGGVVNLLANDANGVANANATDAITLADGTTAGTGTLNTNTFNISTPNLNVGAIATGFDGAVLGTGTVTVTSTVTDWTSGIRLFNGSVAAKLAGVASILKQGLADVTLSGDNSGLTATVAATRIDAGNLILDYTTQNNNKISAVAGLDMRGGTLTLNGNASAPTSQTVASLTLASGGANTITLNPGAGQSLTLNLGAITRAASGGNLRLNLGAGAVATTSTALTNGLLISGFATVNDGTGTWFATKSGSNIVALASVVKNDVTTWVAGDQVTDSGAGFTNSLVGAGLNSLRFNAAGGSDVNLVNGGVLNINSGGILVTDQVTSGSPGIFGGTLATGVTDIIITQDSSQSFEITSRIGVNNALTKSGNGTLRLSGVNVSTGQVQLQAGNLDISGGSGIGDTSLITLADDRATTLNVLNNETIGRLAGGSNTTGLQTLAVVNIGANTLTLNQTAASTYAGRFSGSGTIVKSGASAFTFTGTDPSGNFTGNLQIDQGLMVLSGATNQFAGISGITLTGSTSSLRFDNDQATAVASRIGDTANITLNSTAGVTADALGFYNRRTQGTTTGTETVGQLILNSGHNTVAADGNGTDRVARTLFSNATPLVRNNLSTLLVVARNMNATAGQRGRISFSADPGGSIGGAGAAATTTVNIFPYMVGEDTLAVAASGATHFGNSFVRYDATATDLRPLDLTTEYVVDETNYNALGAGLLTNNIRFTVTPGAALANDTTGINSLVMDSATGITLAGPAQALQVTSGAILSASAGANVINGFTGLTTGAGNPYYFYVTNPAGTLTLASTALTSAQALVKSGAGTLVLGAINSVTSVNLNQGALEITDLDNIGGITGSLAFAGGALRLSSTYSGDDISSRTISFLAGGGTLDTNGNSPTLAGSLGTGAGSFTKTGLGNLTLNAASARTGATSLTTGTITIGANNALGVGGDLTVGAGATLALGTNSISHAQVSTTGLDPVITGTGTITASTGFFFSNTDTAGTSVAAILAGSGGLFKNQANTLTLSGLNTYTGTTEVQAGTLSFDSIANVGGGASALGAPTTVESGVIRVGLTTAAIGLTYTGGGHNTDRIIDLQGTTGIVTINANGSGALGLGTIHTSTPGAKNLTLRGTSAGGLLNSVASIREYGAALSLTKLDANTWELAGANTYTGATVLGSATVDGGTLRALSGSNISNAATTVFSGTLDLENAAQSITTLTMGGGASGTSSTVDLNGTAVLSLGGNITYSATNNPNTATITTGTVNLLGNRTVTVGNSTAVVEDMVIQAVIADGDATPRNLTKAGAGTLVLSGANTYTGTTLASAAGVLRAANNSAFGPTGAVTLQDTDGVLEIANGITIANALSISNTGNNKVLRLQDLATTGEYSGAITIAETTAGNFDVSAETGGTFTLSGAIGGAVAGGVTKVGAGTVVFSGASANTFSGVTTITAGILELNKTVGVNAIVGDGASNKLVADVLINGGTLKLMASNQIDNSVTINQTSGTFNVNGKTETIFNYTKSGGSYLAPRFSNITFVDPVFGAGTYDEFGTVSYGYLEIQDGVNIIHGDEGSGFGSAQATVTNGSAGDDLVFSGTLSPSLILSSDNVAPGILVLQDNVSFTGASGTASIVNGNRLIDPGSSDSLSLGSIAGRVNLDGGTRSFTINDGSANIDMSISAQITNGGITKLGAGALSLSQDNTYAGGTTVSGGTLLVNNLTGSATGTGTVTVSATGTLGGNGSIASPTALAAVNLQGILNVGNVGDSTGQDLAINLTGIGSTINLAGTTNVELFTGFTNGGINPFPAADQLKLTAGSITIDSAAILNVAVAFGANPLDQWANNATWKIFNWSATPVGTFQLANVNLPSLVSVPGGYWDLSNLYNTGVNGGTISIAGIPEPSRAMLLLLGLLGLGLRRRRNRL